MKRESEARKAEWRRRKGRKESKESVRTCMGEGYRGSETRREDNVKRGMRRKEEGEITMSGLEMAQSG